MHGKQRIKLPLTEEVPLSTTKSDGIWIIAHVKRCVLALLLQRAAEIRCQQSWRMIRQTLDP
jgi:hypothetical protein